MCPALQADSLPSEPICCLFTKSYQILCDPVDCSPPGSSVHGASQARVLEWVDFFNFFLTLYLHCIFFGIILFKGYQLSIYWMFSLCILLHFSRFPSFPCHVFFKLMYPFSLSLLPKWPEVFWWLRASIRLLFPSALSAYFKILLHCFIISYLSFRFELCLQRSFLLNFFWLYVELINHSFWLHNKVFPLPKKCLDFFFSIQCHFFSLTVYS